MARLYTMEEAAGRLGISRKTLEREVAANRFPKPLKIGRASRVSDDDLIGYIEMLQHERAKGGQLPTWTQVQMDKRRVEESVRSGRSIPLP